MTLSRGMKQRLSLARTMVHDPALLILDEPASGLDPRARIELRELLKELRALGKTVMISSHILTELAEMCTHIAIIERGRLLAAGDVQTILRSLQPHRILELRILEGIERAEQLLRAHDGVLAVRRDEIAAAAGPVGAPTPVGEPAPDSEMNGDGVAPAAAEPDQTLPPPSGAMVLLVDYAGDERGMGTLLALLVANDVVVTRFAEQSSDLEDIFMQVTKGIVQ
jgi:ABC-2 type transport system ATP-binding protein